MNAGSNFTEKFKSNTVSESIVNTAPNKHDDDVSLIDLNEADEEESLKNNVRCDITLHDDKENTPIQISYTDCSDSSVTNVKAVKSEPTVCKTSKDILNNLKLKKSKSLGSLNEKVKKYKFLSYLYKPKELSFATQNILLKSENDADAKNFEDNCLTNLKEPDSSNNRHGEDVFQNEGL